MFHRSGRPAGTVANHAAHHHKSAGHHSTGHHGAHEHKHKHHKGKKHHHKGKKHHHKGHHAHKGKHGKHHHKGKHGHSHKGKHVAQHHARAFDDELVDRAFDETELYELYARDFEDAPLFARELNDERVARGVEGLAERAVDEGDVMVRGVPSAQGSGAIGIGKVLKTGAHLFGSLFSREDAEEFARGLAEEIVARAMDLDELD